MKKPDSYIISRYLEGNCSREEAEKVLDWLATPEGQSFYSQYLDKQIDQQESSNEQFEHIQLDDQQVLAGIYHKIEQENKRKPYIFKQWYAAAAAIALLIFGAWFFSDILKSDLQTYQTSYAEVEHIELPDGSKVVLNANSKLWYDNEAPREVWFEGEAFFEITHTQDDAPFSVHTNDLVVEVLGTAFNVNTRRKKTDVVLRNGKVRLELPEAKQHVKSLLMKPGDMISYSQTNHVIEKKVVNPESYTSWTDGDIEFDHTSLKEVFQLIEDTYGVQVEIKDSTILNKELSGKAVLNLEVMLTLLEKSFNLNLKQEGETIYME